MINEEEIKKMEELIMELNVDYGIYKTYPPVKNTTAS